MKMKICTMCKIEKPISEFYPHQGCKLGVRPQCKICWNIATINAQKDNERYIKYHAEYYKNNKDKYKKYFEKHKDNKNKKRRDRYHSDDEFRKKALADAKSYRVRNPTRRKSATIKKQYGITLNEYNQMLKDQNNSCAICGFKDDGNKAFFPFIDHCHATKKVRGLLCSKCNFGIGQFNDDTELLEKAITYLKDNKDA